MNVTGKLNFEDMLHVKLKVLRREYRDLDEAIRAILQENIPDQINLQRLKKNKLVLKNQIRQISDQLTPNIIA
ncbi:MAG: hypothetical protein ACI9O0_000492 [Paracoccaceae bacterium]|jgi:hypothetical protein